MARHVDCCIMEAVHVATGVNFEAEVMAKERLRLPARMKGGGVKSAMDLRYPAFLGALLHILPRCIDRKDTSGEITRGTYTDQLTAAIGEGAFDEAGHRNARFLEATEVGPYPREMQRAWSTMREEARNNYGISEADQEDEANKRMGPLVEPTPAGVRNRGAAERKKTYNREPQPQEERQSVPSGNNVHRARTEEEEESQEDMDDLMAAVAGAISQAEREAAKEQKEPNLDLSEEGGRQERSTTPTVEMERQAEARRKASIFLQGMAIPGRGLQREGGTQDYTRRPGKEPAPMVS